MNDLSIVILNYNSFLDTKKCIENLLSFKSDFRIIIVDNCSTDNSFRELKASFSVEIDNNLIDLIQTDRNGGYSYGNNYGIIYSKNKYESKYIAILNPDIFLLNISNLTELKKVLEENDNIALVGGCTIENKTFSLEKSAWDIPNWKNVVLDRALFLHKKITQLTVIKDNIGLTECIVGCFFMIKEDIFNQIGYFDENVFLYNEENILGIKLKRSGYKAAVILNQYYYHNHDFSKDRNKSLTNKLKMLKVRYCSRRYFIVKYYSSLLLPFLSIIEFINAVKITLGHIKWKVLRR